MTKAPTFKMVRSGLRVYLDGISKRAKVWVEPSLDGRYLVRVQSPTLTLDQRMRTIENARQALKERNGGRELQTMQDVLALL